jgi:hypothetical protein
MSRSAMLRRARESAALVGSAERSGFSRSAAASPTRDAAEHMAPRSSSVSPADRAIGLDAPSLRFAAAVPHLRELLQASDGCDRELLLQAAMRTVLQKLAGALGRASDAEASTLRAEELRALSNVATQLARTTRQ